MAEVLVFHHVRGLTDGVRELAGAIRADGHTVHTPDLFDGRVFGSQDEGFAALKEHAPDGMTAWADAVVTDLPNEMVYAGISLGVMSAQRLAQTRPGAKAAILLEACVAPTEFGEAWPAGVPIQVHGMAADPFFAKEGDIDAARDLVASVADGDLFTYPGDVHLFTDSSLPTYDAGATAQVVSRMLELLRRV